MTATVLIVALLSIAVALALIMSGAWMVQQRTKNSGWIDATWTFGLGLVGFVAALWPIADAGLNLRQILVAALIAAWAARLGFHIASRNMRITDDPRYAELIRQWGKDADAQMLWFCMQQAIATVPLALSVFLAAHNPAPTLRMQDVLGIAVLVIAIAGAGLADRQLRAFGSNPANKGKVCDTGLWAWSRHPNYFFEWFGWLAYALFAIDLSGQYPLGWIALAGPACMFWLLNYVSGIPPLEEHMLRTRGEAFRAYQASTSAFFPVPKARR